MSQSKRHSVIETTTNTAVGFFGSFAITYGCMHLDAPLATQTLYATLGCTAWSLLRGYYLRRFFNHLHTKHLLAVAKAGAPEGYEVSLRYEDADPADSLTKRPAPIELPLAEPGCQHLMVDGFGQMGDALTCCKCGLSKYPEALPSGMLERLARQDRVIGTNHPQHAYYWQLVQDNRRKH